MKNLHPFVLLLIGQLLGIVLSRYCNFIEVFQFFLLGLPFSIMITWFLCKKSIQFCLTHQFLFGLQLVFFIFLLAWYSGEKLEKNTDLKWQLNRKNAIVRVDRITQVDTLFVGVIASEAHPDKKTNDRYYLRLGLGEAYPQLNVGDVVLIEKQYPYWNVLSVNNCKSSLVGKYLQRTKQSFGEMIDDRLNNIEIQHFCKAIFIGDKYLLDKPLKEKFRTVGLSHLLAISGFHLGLMVGLVVVVFQKVFGQYHFKKLQIVLISIMIWTYVFMVGATDSILRAGLMYWIYFIATIYRQTTTGMNVLCFTGFILLFISPEALFRIGFQLSFAAIIGIGWLYPLLSKPFQGFIKNSPWYSLPIAYLLECFLVGLAVQLLVSPLLLFHFSEISTYALMSNIIIGPIFIFFMYTALALFAFGYGYLGDWINILLEWMYAGIMGLLNFFSQLPFSVIGVVKPSLFLLLLLYFSLYWVIQYIRKRSILAIKYIFFIWTIYIMVNLD